MALGRRGRARAQRASELFDGRRRRAASSRRVVVEVGLPERRAPCVSSVSSSGFSSGRPRRSASASAAVQPGVERHAFTLRSDSRSRPSTSSSVATARRRWGIVIDPPTTSATLNVSRNSSRATSLLAAPDDMVGDAVVAAQDERRDQAEQFLRLRRQGALFVGARVEGEEALDVEVARAEDALVHLLAEFAELLQAHVPSPFRPLHRNRHAVAQRHDRRQQRRMRGDALVELLHGARVWPASSARRRSRARPRRSTARCR